MNIAPRPYVDDRAQATVRALLVLPLLFAGCLGFWTGEVDAPLPDFRVQDIDGNWQDGNGTVLIDMMGTWCGPCQRSVPDLRAMLEQYPGLRILSLSSTDTEEGLRDFRTQYGVTWPMAVDRTGIIEDIVRAAGGSLIWPSYALSVDGRIVFFNAGETLPSTIAAALPSQQKVEADVAGPAALAAVIGMLAVHTPFLLKATQATQAPPRRIAVVLSILLMAIGAILTFYGRPLAGRLVNTGAILGLAALASVWLWRRKGTDAIQPRRKGPRAYVGSHVYLTAPAWVAIAIMAAKRTLVMEAMVVWAAYAAGVAISLVATWSRGKTRDACLRLGDRAGWIGASGLAMAAAISGWAWMQ